jgi:hypothetical protein
MRISTTRETVGLASRAAGEIDPRRPSLLFVWPGVCAGAQWLCSCSCGVLRSPGWGGGNFSPECATGRNILLSVVGSPARTILGKNHSPGPAFIPIACSPIEFEFHARNPETSPAGVRPSRGGVGAMVWFDQGRKKTRRPLVWRCRAAI